MQRSRSQVLFSYLPGAVFLHETGYIARSISIRGADPPQLADQRVLLEEIDRYLSRWDDDSIQGLRRPSRVASSDFRVLTPEGVRWEIWPLRFECTRERCRRIVSFRRIQDAGRNPRCANCGGRLRQLRYLNAHECGHILPMHVPRCVDHGYEHVYFEDTGTFRTAVFRCRACNGGIIRRTLLSPCKCNRRAPDGDSPKMHAYTVRDTRIYFPHHLSFINLQSQTFKDLQAHSKRGHISVASFLGLLGPSNDIKQGLSEANIAGQSRRLTAEEWEVRERELQNSQWPLEQIQEIRAVLAPSPTGLASLEDVGSPVIEIGERRRVVERAALYDSSEVTRLTLNGARQSLMDRGALEAAQAIDASMNLGSRLGIEDIGVTWGFPIALAAFGFTRSVGKPGEGILQGFANSPDQYEGKYPIFAVATDTEAVLVTLDPARVLRWLAQQDLICLGEEDPRLQVLRVFASEVENPRPAGLVRTLVHTMAHTMLRALDDGQVGFSESSLAEWVVPETLTFALYANNFKSVTMGSLWTLINNRTMQWLERAADNSRRCDNDPLCHQRAEKACERCLYITFGCQDFNRNLDRGVLQSFWRDA